MGWWPLDLKTGGIAWGTDELKGGLMWGDTVADIVDAHLTQLLEDLHRDCGSVFADHIGRAMTPQEFLCGLAFSLNAVEQHEEKIFGKDLPFTLKVEVALVEKEESE